MGPEYLVAGSVLAGAIMVGGSALVGWYVRGKVSAAVRALIEDEIAELKERNRRLREHARKQRAASEGVLASAHRRAGHDSVADPLGVGLLLGRDLPGGPAAPAGEAEQGDSGADLDGPPAPREDPPG